MPNEFDAFSFPEFYITDFVCEDAGGGNLRMVCTVKRGATDYPVYSVVMPAAGLLLKLRQLSQEAERAFNAGQLEHRSETAH